MAPCTEQENLRRFAKMLGKASYGFINKPEFVTKGPCRSMERVHYDLSTANAHNQLNDTTLIALDFTEFTYKEVRNVQGMDDQTLIGKVPLLNTL